jgi:electron transfer flavoprotein alpha subunit
MSALVCVLAPLGLEELDPMPLVAAAGAMLPGAAIEALAFGPDDNADAHVAAFAHALRELPPAVVTLLPAGAEELAARLAVRLGAVALGRCSHIAFEAQGLRAERDAFGGRATASLRVDAPAFATMRAAKQGVALAKAQFMKQIKPAIPLPSPPVIHRSEISAGRKRLEGARVVVSGGRGMAGPEGFAHLEALAASLDAAVGGSLPTVDAGWVPVAYQVGQSGKFVTPEVYVAVAISGTPQHLAGIGPDTRIVAINNDAEADIFRVAEIGVVGDWREIVPALAMRLKSASPPGEGRGEGP